jgi:predicted dehydrogenase
MQRGVDMLAALDMQRAESCYQLGRFKEEEMRKVTWGVLGTSRFAQKRVIPAMQGADCCDVVGIASRDPGRSAAVAKRMGISRAYGSYEELLADSAIEAVYIPLPNHLHVPWAKRALAAGKHVLCEKPIALSSGEARELLRAAKERPDLKVMEGFMYRHHPQWVRASEIVRNGGVGELRTIQSFYSFINVDPLDIRNIGEVGGGSLMDIGCYCISLARFIFGKEPIRVLGLMELDPVLKVDGLTSGILDFGNGSSSFICSIHLPPLQRVDIFGTGGRVGIDEPFNPDATKSTRIVHVMGSETREITFAACDQYAIQAELFSQAILGGIAVPTPLEDAVANMAALECLQRSAQNGGWFAC